MRLRQKLHPNLWDGMVRKGHDAPIKSLLEVVSKPVDEQLAAWKPYGEVHGASAARDEGAKPVRGYSWRVRAARLA